MEYKYKITTIFCEENGSGFLIFYFVEKQLSKWSYLSASKEKNAIFIKLTQ